MIFNLTIKAPTSRDQLTRVLDAYQAAGIKVLIQLVDPTDCLNPTFDLALFQAAMVAYDGYDFTDYEDILFGFFCIDQPYTAATYGGTAVSYATVDLICKEYKDRWSYDTFVRASGVRLSSKGSAYSYLNAGWLQYSSQGGQSAAAELNADLAALTGDYANLNLVTGLNLLDGGDGSSGEAGITAGKFKMSANEIVSYGKQLITGNSKIIAFVTWKYLSSYYNRSDINNALTTIQTLT